MSPIKPEEVDKKHFTVRSLIATPVDILNVRSQSLITLNLTLTIKTVLHVGPETLTLILTL